MKPRCKLGQCARVTTPDGRQTNACVYCGRKLRRFAGRMIKETK